MPNEFKEKKMNRTVSTIALLLTSLGASAQSSYPEKPVRVVAPFPAGSGADITARIVTQKLNELWSRPIVVENVPGAAGSVGAERVAKSAPDGYTLLFSGDAAMTTNVSIYPKLGYDPTRDFAPIMNFVETPNLLVVHPSLPVKNVRELVALAKSRPGEITYASTGAGTSQHLGGALLASRAGLNISHVPFKDPAQAMSDVIGGRVTMFFGNTLFMLPQVRAGKARAIAVSSLQRVPVASEFPTIAESGYPGFKAVAWFGLLAPVGTPAAVLDKLQKDAARVIAMPDVRNKFTENGGVVVGNSSAEFAAQIKAEIVAKGNLVRASGANVN
jgi:tripartite-type tricarboxylate transporter receptor subunit TctC